MTNVAISGLPAATALAGAELVPLVQAGTTARSTVGDVRKFVLGTCIDARDYAIDPTGTTDSAAAGNLAIADAIAQKKPLIWPSGLFKLDSPLLAFTGIQQSFQMYGQGGAAEPSDNIGSAPPQNPVGHPYDANTIFYTNFTNAPALAVSVGRNLVLKDFAILGQNLAPFVGSQLGTGPSRFQGDYITSGCQSGRFAPYCGIAFDPFSNSSAQNVSGISKATSAIVTLSTGGAQNPFVVSQQVVFAGVGGMTQINGISGMVTAIGGVSGAWTATVNINSSAFSTYTSGGTAVGLPFNLGTVSSIVSSGALTNVTLSDSSQVNPFQVGESVRFSGVSGMTQINGVSGVITLVAGTQSAWTLVVNINSSAFSAYTSGGQAVASDAYVSMATNYKPANAGNGTYGCVVENVHISRFVVGIAIGLSGNSSLAADLSFRNVNINYTDVAYAIGQSQSRNLNIEYGNIFGTRTAIDGMNYGAKIGTPPMMLRQNIGFAYRVFALNQSVGNFVVNDCYAESIVCLGQYGLGSASSATPMTFIGGDFSFGGAGWLKAAFLLETYGATSFAGTSFSFISETPAQNFIAPMVPLRFDHCLFFGTSLPNTAPHIALNPDAGNGGYAKFLDCWVNGGPFGGASFLISSDLGRSFGVSKFTTATGRLSAIYQTYRVSNGTTECFFEPNQSTPGITVFGVSAMSLSVSNVTFSCTNAAQLMVGDIIFWVMLRQGYSLLRFSVPALKISNIAGTSVTCSLLFDPSLYDSVANQTSSTQIAVAPNHWAPTQALTCTMNGTTTLSSVSPTTVLQNGDFLAGAGIPANSRVVSGGGTATIVISQAATSSASGVQLYFGRLYVPSVTPLA